VATNRALPPESTILHSFTVVRQKTAPLYYLHNHNSAVDEPKYTLKKHSKNCHFQPGNAVTG
jgi:hypothetical protein